MTLQRKPPPVPAPSRTEKIPLGYLRVKLDDIDDALHQLRSAGFSPILLAGNAQASNADDLKSATGEELNKVQIGVDGGALAVRLTRELAEIEYRRDDTAAERASQDVVAMLRARRVPAFFPWLRQVFRMVMAFSIVVVLVAIASWLLPNAEDLSWQYLVQFEGIVLICAAIVGTVNHLAVRSRGGVKVDAYFRRERREVMFSATQTVWIALFVGVVAAIAGAVVGALLSPPSS